MSDHQIQHIGEAEFDSGFEFGANFELELQNSNVAAFAMLLEKFSRAGGRAKEIPNERTKHEIRMTNLEGMPKTGRRPLFRHLEFF